MSDFVRVREENGIEVSMPAAVAEAAGLKPLKKDAIHRDGSILPPKPRVPLGGASAETTEARSGSVSKEK